jgi:tol-pal system protein YbgF
MRSIGNCTLACAAVALMVAVPAMAETRASLADRVAALEIQVQQNQSQQSVAQLNRIAQLESDIKDLRSQVEQLQNDNAQLKQHGREQYIDLDSRLGRLEGGSAAGANGNRAPAGNPAAPGPGPSTAAPVASSAGSAGAAAPAGAANAGGEQQSYDAALAAVRDDQYADAARRFQAFVQQYPDSALAPNAYYWMGESYYVTQNYQLALDAFKAVVTRYPDSPKSPGALLKIGYSQDGLKHHDAAVAILREVIDRYPGSEVARQAQGRLREISLDAHQ